MSFYDDPKNAEDYIEIAKGYDGAELIKLLEPHLETGSSLLELGMGPGVDLNLLAEKFAVTGSDTSAYFVNRYKELHPKANAIQADAVTIESDNKFDCIYSNKVLHHLSDDELNHSFKRQAEVLNPSGIILHSFWFGDEVMKMHGMTFYYRQIQDVTKRIEDHFDTIDAQKYDEMDAGDSFWVLARKR